MFTGEDPTVLISGLNYPRSLILDGSNNVLYWLQDRSTRHIQAATLNGTILQSIPLASDIFLFTVLGKELRFILGI